MGAMTELDVVSQELETVDSTLPVLFERDDTFLSSLEKASNVEKVGAKDARVPLAIRPGGKFGHFNPAGGDLGRGSGHIYKQATIGCVFLKYAIEWQIKAEWATDDRKKAIENSVQTLTSDAMAEFRRNLDSICLSGGNGVLGTVSAIDAATTPGTDIVTLDSDGFGTRLLRYNMDLNVYNSTLATHRNPEAERTISYIDHENKIVKYPSVAGCIVGDKIVASGLSGATPTSVYGVPYHASNASTGTWLGMDRSLYPEIRANRVDASSAGLSLPFPRRARNKLLDRLGKDKKFRPVAWMHMCQKQAYEELGQLVSVINKTASDEGLDLYFGDNMQLAGCPIETHASWDKTRIDFIVPGIWKRVEMKSIGWYEVQGRRIFEIRGASGGVATSNVSYLVLGFNIYPVNPAAVTYIDNLLVPSGY